MSEQVKSVMTEEIKDEHLKSIVSDKSWDDIHPLSPEVREKIKQVYPSPTKIQYLSIGETIDYIQPVITIKCRNGGGKTLSFAIPALEFAYRNKDKQTSKQQQSIQEIKGQNTSQSTHVYCPTSIIIVSTQPLAQQILSVFNNIPIEGVSQEVLFQDQKINQTGQILISTPDLLYKYIVKEQLIQLDNLCHIAIDEADNMLSTFQLQIERVFTMLKGRDIIIQLVSATLSEHNIKFIHDTLKFDVTKGEEEELIYSIELPWKLKGVTQFYQQVEGDQFQFKYNCCKELINRVIQYNNDNVDLSSQVIIFFRKIQNILTFEDQISKEKLNWKLTSCANKARRNQNIQEFRDGNFDIMLASAVMSRGIDIRKVGLVINFDMPIDYVNKQFDKDSYLHNIGRTGRFADLGLSLTFFDNPGQKQNAQEVIKREFQCDIFPYSSDKIINELKNVMINNNGHDRIQ